MSDLIGSMRLILALPIFFVGTVFNLLSIYVGGERFAEIYIASLKKRVADL